MLRPQNFGGASFSRSLFQRVSRLRPFFCSFLVPSGRKGLRKVLRPNNTLNTPLRVTHFFTNGTNLTLSNQYHQVNGMLHFHRVSGAWMCEPCIVSMTNECGTKRECEKERRKKLSIKKFTKSTHTATLHTLYVRCTVLHGRSRGQAMTRLGCGYLTLAYEEMHLAKSKIAPPLQPTHFIWFFARSLSLCPPLVLHFCSPTRPSATALVPKWDNRLKKMSIWRTYNVMHSSRLLASCLK